LNNRDAGACTSYALVCMIQGDIEGAIVSLHEVFMSSFLLIYKALTISPADQIANELMSRALLANADLTFEMKFNQREGPNVILENTDRVLEIRRAQLREEKAAKAASSRAISQLTRKLRFSTEAQVHEEEEDDMDTN